MTLTSSVPSTVARRSLAPRRTWGMWPTLALCVATLAGQMVPALAWTALPFWLLVPGALVVRLLPSTGLPLVGLVPALSISVVVLVSSGSLWAGGWTPVPTTVVVAALGALYSVFHLSRQPRPVFAFPRGAWAITAAVTGVLAAVLWLISLPRIAAERIAFGPLVMVPTFTAALLLAVLAFGIALRLRDTGLLWTMLALTCLIQRGVAPLALGAPWADWAYKHLGVVELIASTGALQRGLDIYQGWPGFFAAFAWIGEASRLSTIAMATWFTLAVTFASAGAVYLLARALRLETADSLAAAMVALLANWIGQDYFAPQAIGYIQAIVVAALALRARRSRAAWVMAVICFGALVITHQLTPFWLLGALFILAVLRRVPWLLLVACGALALAQLAVNFDIADGYGLFSGFNPVSNAQTNSVASTPGAELAIQQMTARIASVGLWGLAILIAFLGLIENSRRVWFRGTGPVAVVLAFSPFAILLAQNYGGEALLRVMLYSIPGCSLLVGPWLARQIAGATWRRLIAGAVALFLALVPGHAYFATFYHYGVTKAEYEVEAQLERSVPGHAFLSPLSTYWPSRSTENYAARYAEYWDYDQSLQNVGGGIRLPDYLDVLEAHLEERPSPTFVLVGPRMDAFAAYSGFAREGTIERVRGELRQRARWDTVLERDGVSVFRYVPEHAREQEAARWLP
ncbi:MAG: hypothetical protein QM708_14595 [Propioniciclava sp.]|uniref:hypothetical protein n=1 Tax=Propioniciclava sp. TaxID=2038686 RepID=UPI0039E61167